MKRTGASTFEKENTVLQVTVLPKTRDFFLCVITRRVFNDVTLHTTGRGVIDGHAFRATENIFVGSRGAFLPNLPHYGSMCAPNLLYTHLWHTCNGYNSSSTSRCAANILPKTMYCPTGIGVDTALRPITIYQTWGISYLLRSRAAVVVLIRRYVPPVLSMKNIL